MDEDEDERIQWMRNELAVDRERGRRLLLEMGETPARIAALMEYAERMHAEQIACTERRLGLAPPVAVH